MHFTAFPVCVCVHVCHTHHLEKDWARGSDAGREVIADDLDECLELSTPAEGRREGAGAEPSEEHTGDSVQQGEVQSK